MIKLIGSLTSPYVRKVRVCANELGVELTFDVANPWQDEPTVVKANPLTKVPALILDNDETLYDSRVICEFLDGLSDKASLFSKGEDRWLLLTGQSLADGILDAAVLRFVEDKRPQELASTEWKTRQKEKIDRALDHIETIAKSWDQNVNIQTLSTAVALSYLDFRFDADRWRQNRPKLSAWHEIFAERQAMRDTVPVE